MPLTDVRSCWREKASSIVPETISAKLIINFYRIYRLYLLSTGNALL